MEASGKSIIDLSLILFSIPVKNNYRVVGEFSCSDKLLNGFPDRSQWVELLQEKTLQGMQHLCHALPCKFLKGDGCNA